MQFSIPTAEDVPELKKYLIKEFFTSEPLCKNMIENGGWFSKKLVVGSSASFCTGNNFFRQFSRKNLVISKSSNVFLFLEPVTKVKHSPGCIIARSTVSGNIVGARIGKVISKDDPVQNERVDWMATAPKWLHIPYSMVYWGNIGPLFEKMRFGHSYMFKDLPDAKMIYYCTLLSVGGEAQGKGLGTELFRRGYELAKQVRTIKHSS